MKNIEQRFTRRLLAEYMRVHDLDQKAMAGKLFVSQSTLCEWLNPDGHGISKKHIERISFICRDVISQITPAVESPDQIEKFRFAVIAAVMSSDELSADVKDTFYHILKTVEIKK